MPSLQHETERLEVAEVHVARGTDLLERQRNLLAELRSGKDDALIRQAEMLCDRFEDALAQYVLHRDQIASTIEDIKAGRLRDAEVYFS
jgi:hypothetical protein